MKKFLYKVKIKTPERILTTVVEAASGAMVLDKLTKTVYEQLTVVESRNFSVSIIKMK